MSYRQLSDRRGAGQATDWLTVAAVTVAAALALVGFMLLGGAAPKAVPFGLPDAGPGVGWLLPVFRLLMDLSAVGTVGCLLYAAVLEPAPEPDPRSAAGRALRTAVWGALAWAVTAAVGAVLTLADISGLPLSELLRAGGFAQWLVTVDQSRQLLLVAGMAGLVLLVTRGVRSTEGPLLALALAIGALLPPLLSGHAAAEGFHTESTVSLIVHVVAVSAWVGGLAALLTFGRSPTGVVPAVRFSALALGCFVAAAASGVLNAWIRLRTGDGVLTELVGSSYGWLVLGKLTALGVLAGFGYWHRHRTLDQLAAGRPGAFRRFAGCEVLVMVATIALAVALSHTPTPVREPTEVGSARLAHQQVLAESAGLSCAPPWSGSSPCPT